ncbi:MAG: type II secretion system protein [Clostridia bacterium]|nr:type II secretion system protein [Clostridia bacterium]
MKNAKKGFTLVELLVVIAMLAILATVTVVGLTGCIEEAKLSVDLQGVEQMNTALEAASVTGAPKNFKEFDKILTDAGFNTEEGIRSLVDGYAIYWYKTHNVVVLAKDDGTLEGPGYEADMAADFANDFASKNNIYDLAMCGSKFYVGDAPVGSLQEALNIGGKINLASDIEIDTMVNVSKDTELNLNGYSITSTIASGRPFNVVGNVKFTLNAEDSEVAFGAYGLIAIKGSNQEAITANVVINGGSFEGEMDNGAFIKVVNDANATVILNNVTYKDNTNLGCTTDVGTDVSYITHMNSGRNCLLDIQVNGGKYDADCGFIAPSGSFENVTINARGFGIYAINASIEGCSITTTNIHDVGGHTPAAAVAVSNAGTITVNDSVLNAGEDGDATALYSGKLIEITNSAITGNHHTYGDSEASVTVDGVAQELVRS